MNTSSDIRKLQRKIYFSYHQDGIIDLVIGCGAIGFSIFMATELVALLILSWLPMLVYLPLKNTITVPRFGYVNFTSHKTSVLRLALLAGVGVLALLFFVALTTLTRGDSISLELEAWLQRYHMAVLGGLFAIVATFVAALLGLKRFYLYGVLAVGLPALGGLLNLHTFIPVMTVGAIVAMSGCWLLVRFIRRYSAEEGEGSNVRQ
jgi:hypothetical protein